jgi:hypothetical protein
MARRPRLRVDVNPQEVRDGFAGLFQPIRTAAELAIEDADRMLLSETRAHMAMRGFSRRFQNATRSRVYIGAQARGALAATFLHHKAPWAGVHEDGATITGSPRMFIPVPGMPERVRGNRRMTVENYRIAGLTPLFPIRGRGGETHLAAKLRVPRGQTRPRITMSRLRRGAEGRRGEVRAVVLFIGVRQVTIPKSLDVAGVARRVDDELPRLYFRHLRDE